MSDWQSAALGDLSEVFNGKTPSKDEQRADGFPVLKIRDVDEFGRFRGKGKSFVDSSFAKKYAAKWLQSNDILILNAAHNAAYVASKTYYAGEAVAGFLPTGEWLIVRVKSKKVLPAFVDFWLKTPHTRESIRDLVKGIHLYPKDVATLKIPLPPLDEQRRIVGLLDRAAEIRRRADVARAKARAIIPALFLDTFGDPATNPKGWPTNRLGDLADRMGDGPFGSNLKTEHYTESGVRVWRLQNIGVGDVRDDDKAFISDAHFESIRRHECLPGDVIIGTLGEPNLRAIIQPTQILRAINKADCVQFRPNIDRVNASFICALMNQPGMLALCAGQILGQTRARISMGRLREVVVPVPPLYLQTAFAGQANHLESLARHLDDAAAKAEAMAAALSAEVFG